MAEMGALVSAEAAGPMDPEIRRRIWRHILTAVGLGLLPVVRLGQLKENTDIAVTTAVLFIGAAWHIWFQASHAAPVPATRRTWVIVAIMAFTGWQLAWVGAEDFWFLRLSLVVIAAAWVVAWWGAAGLIRGWRVLAAFGLWAVWCNGVHERAGSGAVAEWLSYRTAESAGWILWQCGLQVEVQDNVLRLAQGAVSVGRPCTAIPLTLLLGMLLVFAALLLRLRWMWVVLLGGLAVVVAFLLSLVRVALLALLVKDPARFLYWHGTEGGGWFTAAGMLVLAWAIGKAGSGWPEIHRTETTAPLSPSIRCLGWPVLLAGVAAWLTTAGTPAAPTGTAGRPPVWPGRLVATDGMLPPDATEPMMTNCFAWLRRVVYTTPASASRIEVRLAYVPVMISGDPRAVPQATSYLMPFGNWRLRSAPGGGELWEGQDGARRIWVATVPVIGPPLAVRTDWQARLRQNTSDLARWWGWLTHREHLRDKRAFWLAVSWQGPEIAAGPESALAFATWLRYLCTELPASHPPDS
jgi:exosortase/archaeosortase family protein